MIALTTMTAAAAIRVPHAQTWREVLRLGRGVVTDLAWSPDSQTLAAASSIGVWVYTAELEPIALLEGHTLWVSSVDWSPDGDRLATGSWDDTARIWLLAPGEAGDAASGVPVALLEGHANWVTDVAWSPRGTPVATVSYDLTARLWDAGSGAQVAVLEGHTEPVEAVAWSPDGSRLAAGSENGAALVWQLTFDAAGGAEAGAQLWLNPLLAVEYGITSLAWHPQEPLIAGGMWNGGVKLWDADTGALVAELRGHEGAVNALAWSPGGDRLATASADGMVRIWDAVTRRQIATIRAHGGEAVNALAWSGSGLLASAGADGDIRLWEVVEGMVVRRAAATGHWGEVEAVAWSADGKRVFARGADGAVRAWEVTGNPGEVIRTWEDAGGEQSPVDANVAARTRDASLLARAENRTVRIVDAATGAELGGWEAPGALTSLAWSPDGALLAGGTGDGPVYLWRLAPDEAAGELAATLKGHTDSVAWAAWSPDGDRLATASADGTVRIWARHESFPAEE